MDVRDVAFADYFGARADAMRGTAFLLCGDWHRAEDLVQVPPRQRTALVLRYWEDLSVEETARAMRCSVGTVKSQAARGLQAMRDLLPSFAAAADMPREIV